MGAKRKERVFEIRRTQPMPDLTRLRTALDAMEAEHEARDQWDKDGNIPRLIAWCRVLVDAVEASEEMDRIAVAITENASTDNEVRLRAARCAYGAALSRLSALNGGE